MVYIGPLVALPDLQKLLACFIWISSLSLVPLVVRDKITPLPLEHFIFPVSVQGMCCLKLVGGLVVLLGPALGCDIGAVVALLAPPASAGEVLPPDCPRAIFGIW